jgi:hypothetical protein
MDMEVIHGLPSVGFTVDDKAGAFPGAALFRGEFLGRIEKPSQQGSAVVPKFHDIRDMLFGDHQKMDRRLGGGVVEGENILVLEDLPGGDFAFYDSAKNTIAHGNQSNTAFLFFPVRAAGLFARL